MSTIEDQLTIFGIDVSHLTVKQRTFIERWALTGCSNLTQAAKEAGYKNPNVQGTKLSQMDDVARIMDKVRKIVGKEVQLTLEKVKQKLNLSLDRNYHALATLCPEILLIPPECFPFIDGWEIEPVTRDVKGEDGGYYPVEVGKKIKLKFMPNATAIDLAMKHLGGYAAEKSEQKISISWDSLTEPPSDADSVEREIENVEYNVKKLEDLKDLEDNAFGDT